jgi:hypothetical protein
MFLIFLNSDPINNEEKYNLGRLLKSTLLKNISNLSINENKDDKNHNIIYKNEILYTINRKYNNMLKDTLDTFVQLMFESAIFLKIKILDYYHSQAIPIKMLDLKPCFLKFFYMSYINIFKNYIYLFNKHLYETAKLDQIYDRNNDNVMNIKWQLLCANHTTYITMSFDNINNINDFIYILQMDAINKKTNYLFNILNLMNIISDKLHNALKEADCPLYFFYKITNADLNIGIDADKLFITIPLRDLLHIIVFNGQIPENFEINNLKNIINRIKQELLLKEIKHNLISKYNYIYKYMLLDCVSYINFCKDSYENFISLYHEIKIFYLKEINVKIDYSVASKSIIISFEEGKIILNNCWYYDENLTENINKIKEILSLYEDENFFNNNIVCIDYYEDKIKITYKDNEIIMSTYMAPSLAFNVFIDQYIKIKSLEKYIFSINNFLNSNNLYVNFSLYKITLTMREKENSMILYELYSNDFYSFLNHITRSTSFINYLNFINFFFCTFYMNEIAKTYKLHHMYRDFKKNFNTVSFFIKKDSFSLKIDFNNISDFNDITFFTSSAEDSYKYLNNLELHMCLFLQNLIKEKNINLKQSI